jgi:hypothetical protein
MATMGPWSWLLAGELLAVALAFGVGRSLAGDTEPAPAPVVALSPARLLESPRPVEPPTPEQACDPARLDTARARIDQLRAELERPQRRLAEILAQNPDLVERVPTYAAEDDPSLYDPERLRENLEDLYRACGRMDAWLGYDCSRGYCLVVAQRTGEPWSECDAWADWTALYSKWSTLSSFTTECDDGSSLPVVIWGPSFQPGRPPAVEPPSCEGLEAAECEAAIEAHQQQQWDELEASRAADAELARQLGCGHAP